MKNILALVLAAVMTISLASCGDSSKKEESVVTTKQTETTTNSSVQSSQQSSEEITTPSLQSVDFDNNLAICYNDNEDPTFAIVCVDGTIKTKGNNNCGQLGIGDMNTHDDWQSVAGLSNIKQVVGYDGFFLALTSSGELYYWGRSFLTPQKMKLEYAVVNICKYAKNLTLGGRECTIQTDSGDFYIVAFTYNGSSERFSPPKLTKLNIPKDSIPVSSYISSKKTTDGYIMYCRGYISNNTCFFIADDNYTFNLSSVFNLFLMEETDKYTICDGYWLINNSKNVAIRIDEKQQYTNLDSNEPCKKYLCGDKTNTSYFLYNDGVLKAKGDNKYGELGDGSTNRGASDPIEILNNVKDIYIDYYATAYALTNDNALYAWGNNFSATPTPIITPQDFY